MPADFTETNCPGHAQAESKARRSGESSESSGPVLTPLTGRDTEVALLKDRWDQAQEGMGQVVLIVGEAGLGKSRLVHTITERVMATEEERISDPASGTSGSQRVSPVIEWH